MTVKVRAFGSVAIAILSCVLSGCQSSTSGSSGSSGGSSGGSSVHLIPPASSSTTPARQQTRTLPPGTEVWSSMSSDDIMQQLTWDYTAYRNDQNPPAKPTLLAPPQHVRTYPKCSDFQLDYNAGTEYLRTSKQDGLLTVNNLPGKLDACTHS